tara:strand:+ start:17734 stop:19164 length:1431 start_codon:yes stop_codon:yes gene_type:complete
MATRSFDPQAERTLRRLSWWLVAALLLLVGAGLRHHLVWGESASMPWLPTVLNLMEGACLCGFAAVSAVVWWRAMALLDGCNVDRAKLLRLSLPILIAAILVPCFLTADPVDYVIRGRILSLHGGNPYRDVALDYPADPFVAFGDRGWKDMTLPYGPLVANLQAAIAWLANLLPVSPRIELISALVLFKLVFAAALVGCATVAARIAELVRPGSAAVAFVAVLWNPLLLNDCLANAHNDSLVLLCVLLAVLAAMATRFATMVVALCLGAMTKVVPVVLGPTLFLYGLRAGKLSRLAVGSVISAALLGAFYLQFFTEVGVGAALQRQSELKGASLWWAVHQLTDVSLATLTTVGRALVLLWVGVCCQRLWRRPEPPELLFATASSLLMLAVFGAALFGTWYHVWWLPLGLLLGRGYLYRAAVCVTVTSSFAYLMWASTRRFGDIAQWWIVTTGVLLPLLAAVRLPRPKLPRSAPAAT